jgi:hypothetical protein
MENNTDQNLKSGNFKTGCLGFIILFALIILSSFSTIAQTITPKPIYEGRQSLTISKLESGAIYFGFQNTDYQTIIDRKSFTVSSKEKAIELMDRALYILSMDKTDKDQNIEDKFQDDIENEFDYVSLKRYGFAQNKVYVGNRLMLTNNECIKIKEALINYQN